MVGLAAVELKGTHTDKGDSKIPASSLIHVSAIKGVVNHKQDMHYNKIVNMFGESYLPKQKQSLEEGDRELQSCSSCQETLTFSANVDGTLTAVIFCDIPFSVGLSTGAINVLNPVCDCVSGSSSGPVPAPAPPVPAPSPPSPGTDDRSSDDGYVYGFAVIANDDNVPNTVTAAAGPVPTTAPTITTAATGSRENSHSLSSLSPGVIGGVVAATVAFVALAAVALYCMLRPRIATFAKETVTDKGVELSPEPPVDTTANVSDKGVKLSPEPESVSPMVAISEESGDQAAAEVINPIAAIASTQSNAV